MLEINAAMSCILKVLDSFKQDQGKNILLLHDLHIMSYKLFWGENEIIFSVSFF